jgi:hypothetical protein
MQTYLIDAVIVLIVHPIVNLVDIISEFLRIEVSFNVLFVKKFVECRVQDPNDLARLIVDFG